MAINSTGNNSWFSKLFSPSKWRLQAKLLVPVLMTVILSFIITTMIVSVLVTDSINKQVKSNLIDLDSTATEQISQYIKLQADDFTLQSEKNIAVNAIGEMSKWDRAKKEEEYKKSLDFNTYKTNSTSQNFYLTRAWIEQMKLVKGMKEIMVMDINGMTFCATNELSDPNNASDDWFTEAKKNWQDNKTYCTVRGPEYDESTDDFAVYLTSPIRRAGEDNVYGWISCRLPTSVVFKTAIEYNARTNAQNPPSDKSIAWCTKDFYLVGIQETYRLGTNIGPKPAVGKREINYHIDVLKDWIERDGKYYLTSDPTKEAPKTSTSSLVGQIANYKKNYVEYKQKIADLNSKTPKPADYEIQLTTLKNNLRNSSFESAGQSSQGLARAYSVDFIDAGSTYQKNIDDRGFIFVRQSQYEFYGPVRNIQATLIIIILIMVILSIIILVIVARSIVHPILILRGSLVEVSLGNYSIKVPVTTQDEIGDLANTFNQMLSDIRRYIVTEEERGIKDREIGELIETLSKMAAGDLASRASVPPDEIGALADSVNYLAEQLSDKIQTEEAKEQQDKQIANLLSTVSEMSTGDMTKSAEVTADVLGAVADSVNYMGEQIRKIIADVAKVSLNISTTSEEVIKSSELMSKDARDQHAIIADTSAAVDEMAISINQVSQSAESAAQAAETSAKIAETGGRTVEEAVDAMNRIRGSVAEISKRIKKLGESSQEIGEIVNVISDIAAQTNMLALNAAIEAARAGEQGRGFSVVADAVRQLAERSTKSTKDITLLIRGIQSETSEAIKTMEDSTQEVVEGSKLAEAARERLEEIVGNSRQLAELIQSISLSSRQQSRATEEVNKSMGLISTITNSTTKSIVDATNAVIDMNKLVDQLKTAVQRFKI